MRKIFNLIALILNSIILLIISIFIIRNIITVNSAAAIGIIGESDGPTAIFYSLPQFPFYIIFSVIILLLIIYEIVFLINIKSKNIRKNNNENK